MVLLCTLLSLGIVPKNNLIDQITSELMKTYSGYKSIEIELTKPMNVSGSVELSSSKNISVNNNIALVPVRINTKGTVTEKYISVRIKLFKDVYKCVREVNRNISFKTQDCRIETIDVASFNKKPLETTIPVNSFISRTNLRTGEIVFHEDIIKTPLVKNGDRITAQYNLNGICVSFEAVARQNGAEGDYIIVASSDRKQFKGKIINCSTVEIMQ
jgi:flagella basal body P-ring formation protein FlgA